MNIIFYLKLIVYSLALTSYCSATLIDTITLNHNQRQKIYNGEILENSKSINTYTIENNEILNDEHKVKVNRTASQDEKEKIAKAVFGGAWADVTVDADGVLLFDNGVTARTHKNPYLLDQIGHVHVDNPALRNHFQILYWLDNLAHDVAKHICLSAIVINERLLDQFKSYEKLYTFDGFSKSNVAAWLEFVRVAHDRGRILQAEKQFSATINLLKPTVNKLIDEITSLKIMPWGSSSYKEVQSKKEILQKEINKVRMNSSKKLRPFLLRFYEFATFDGDGKFITTSEERLFYTWMEQSGKPIVYRGEPFNSTSTTQQNADTFYNSGSDYTSVSKRYEKIDGGIYCDIQPGVDIYDIREDLFDFELMIKSKRKPILLCPNHKDDHATTVLSILDLENKRVLTTILLNSWISENYYEYLAHRFNLSSHYSRTEDNLLPECKNAILSRFEKHVDQNWRGKTCISGDWKIPFIDCSFNLQTNEDDSNCVLYTYDYIKAIANMCQDGTTTNRLVKNGKILFNDHANQDAIKDLKQIFQEDVKSYLPQFYNAGIAHPYKDLKLHGSRPVGSAVTSYACLMFYTT